MGDRMNELVAGERNKTNTKLQTEELRIRRELEENIDKQNQEQAKKQHESLVTAAAEGDDQARSELEAKAIAEKEQEIRDDVQKDLDKKLDNLKPEDGENDAQKQAIQEQKDQKKQEKA